MNKPAQTIHKNPGFTLIEVLIVISIIMLIAGFLLPAFANFLDRQTLIQATEKVKSDVKTIQNKALAGSAADTWVQTNDGGIDEHPDWWGIRFDNSTETDYISFVSYEVNEDTCYTASPHDPNEQPTNPNQLMRYFDEYTLPEDITFRITVSDTSNDYSCIFFSMKNGDIHAINFDGVDNATTEINDSPTFTLIYSELGEDSCINITVNPFGMITNSAFISCEEPDIT